MASRATIHDVARRAGCSVATVSRVLNGTGPASQAVRARVAEAVSYLGFRFNEIGRSLQARRSRTLGILVPSLSNPVFAAVLDGVQATARERGYQLLLSCCNYDVAQETAAIETLLANQVDGLILTLSDADGSVDLAELSRDAVPYVLLFNQPGKGQPAVTVDNRAAARRVAAVLLEVGHREVAYVAGRFCSSDRSRQRFEGFVEAYESAGAPTPRLLEVDYTSFDHRRALAGLLSERPAVSALFCSNDMLALAVMGALRRLGRRVPEEISVVGFDGIDVAALNAPSLATIATPCPDMGRQAAERLIAAVEEDRLPAPQTLLLPFEFRPGESIAPGPVRNPLPASGHSPADARLHPVSPEE